MNPGSPLARPLPRSPKVAKLRQEIAQKSPVRSPLREVLKKRCAERMKNSRDKMVAGRRGIEDLESIRQIVKSEATKVRGRKRSLTFGISAAEVDEALADLDSIEEELLFELGVDCIPNLGVLCPLCVRSPLKETSEELTGSVLSCSGPCGPVLKVKGGLNVAEEMLDSLVNSHDKTCEGSVEWCRADVKLCLLAVCDHCDLLEVVGDV